MTTLQFYLTAVSTTIHSRYLEYPLGRHQHVATEMNPPAPICVQ